MFEVKSKPNDMKQIAFSSQKQSSTLHRLLKSPTLNKTIDDSKFSTTNTSLLNLESENEQMPDLSDKKKKVF